MECQYHELRYGRNLLSYKDIAYLSNMNIKKTYLPATICKPLMYCCASSKAMPRTTYFHSGEAVSVGLMFEGLFILSRNKKEVQLMGYISKKIAGIGMVIMFLLSLEFAPYWFDCGLDIYSWVLDVIFWILSMIAVFINNFY